MKAAVIRIRGLTGIKPDAKKTMQLLKLYRKNYCVVVENNPSITGMIKKIKDYVAWGEINDETYKALIEKRGKEYMGREKDRTGKIKYKFWEVNGKKLKPFFALAPPKGGFERKGIKKPFKEGGALGYRGEKINRLIMRML